MFFRLLFGPARVMSTLVKASVKDGVQLIGINRPEKKNCVNHQTALELIAAFEKFEQDDQAKIAGPTAMKLRKPLIAAVEGHAVAGGLEMSLLADLRVAGSSSTFGVFCRRVGVPLIDGGTVRLPRILGTGRALDMILTGRAVSAQEALQWGLVNRVVEDGQTLSYAIKLAKEIISHPYGCMLADRESLYYSLDHPFDQSMLKELASLTVLPDAIKQAQKFVEKKIPPPSKL